MPHSDSSKNPPSTNTHVDVAELIHQGQLSTEPFRMEAICSYEESDFSGTVTGHLKFVLNPTGFRVEGSVSGPLFLQCDSCGETYTYPTTIEVQESFVLASYGPSPHHIAKKEQQLFGEDYYEVIDDDSFLDIHDLIRQLIVLELTTSHWCQKPHCGHESQLSVGL